MLRLRRYINVIAFSNPQVERERDKERLEMKRRIEQMKKNADEEQEEVRKKLHEVRIIILIPN